MATVSSKRKKNTKNKKETKKEKTSEVTEEEVPAEEKAEKAEKVPSRGSSNVEDILFKVPYIVNPLIGKPKDVREELDEIALGIKNNPDGPNVDDEFNRIHVYMQGYFINVVLRQFPYIKGSQTSDVYQEALFALRFKAIPKFELGKGMSFLNWAKMCIRSHLITLLNTSNTRQKDQCINQAISLDHAPSNGDDDSKNTLANLIPDKDDPVDIKSENAEALAVTRETLLSVLSDFEQIFVRSHI